MLYPQFSLTSRNRKKLLKKLSKSLVFALSIGISIPLLGAPSASADDKPNHASIHQAPLFVFFNGAATSPTRQLFAQGGSGSGAVSFEVEVVGTTALCSISGATLTFSSQGTCSVKAKKDKDLIYKNQSSSPNLVPYSVPVISVVLGAPGITDVRPLSSSSIRVFFNSVPNATGYRVNVYNNVDGSPLPGNTVTVFTSASGPLNLDVTGLVQNVQDPLTYLWSEYQFRAVALGNGVAFLNSNESGTWTGKTLMEPLWPLALSGGSIPFGYQWILNAAGGSPFGTLTFALGSGGSAIGCAISGNLLSSSSAGTCLVTAQKSADRNYTATTSPQVAITFTAINQTPLYLADGSATYGETINLAATGGSGSGTVTYALAGGATNSAGCSITGSVLSALSAGTCWAIATKAGDNSYLPRSSSVATFTFAKAEQAAVVLADGSGTFGDVIAFAATGGSGDGVLSYVVTNGTAEGCALNADNALTSNSAGTCSITATRAESRSYLERSSTVALFTFAKANQAAIVLTSIRAKVSTPLTLIFTGGLGTGAVTYTVSDSHQGQTCVIVNGSLIFKGIGVCNVTVFKAGDSNYHAASSAPTPVSFVSRL